MPTKTYMNRLKLDDRSRANHIFVTPFALTSFWLCMLLLFLALQANSLLLVKHSPQLPSNTVKPEMFTTFLFSRLSRITKIREIKKSEKIYLFSYLLTS